MQLIAGYVPSWLRKRGMIKMFMIMKLTAILMLAFCINVNAKVYAQNVSLNEVNAPLDIARGDRFWPHGRRQGTFWVLGSFAWMTVGCLLVRSSPQA